MLDYFLKQEEGLGERDGVSFPLIFFIHSGAHLFQRRKRALPACLNVRPEAIRREKNGQLALFY